MANELNIALAESGKTVTAQRYQAGAASGSPISLTEISASGFYTGDMTGSAGTYFLVFNDGAENVGTGSIVWDGTAEVPGSTFNPATDTVARVTLTDTATTLTNAPTSVTPSDIWSHATRTITGGTVTTLTNAPTVPTAAAIADEVRVELATELAHLDADISSRAVAGDIPASDISAIKAKTDLLNTDRLAQCSTVSTTGAQLAAALS